MATPARDPSDERELLVMALDPFDPDVLCAAEAPTSGWAAGSTSTEAVV
ncbi:hypothetical protein ABZ595_19230 [Streptomyces rubradiris]